MPTGKWNPLPFRCGGEKTPTQRAYEAHASAVGPGNVGPADGVRELWRLCLARAFASAADQKQRATLQAFPQTMTVALSEMQRYLGLPVQELEVDARAGVHAAIIYQPDATGPSMSEALRAIDENFSLDSIPWSAMAVMIPGRVFGSGWGYGQAAGVASAVWGHFGDSFVKRVLYTLPAGQTEIPIDSLGRAERLLNEILPVHESFEIYNLTDGADGPGFYLDGGADDTSLLDQTAL